MEVELNFVDSIGVEQQSRAANQSRKILKPRHFVIRQIQHLVLIVGHTQILDVRNLEA